MSSVARRYAKAILAVVEQEGQLEQTAEELANLARVTEAPLVASALRNPLLSGAQRRSLADTIATDLSLRPTIVNFIRVLADHKRLDQIPAIADQYGLLLDEKLGRVRAVVTSAVAIEPADVERIVAAFEQKTGKKVLAETVVDESLLGGVTVNIKGQVFDGSLRRQLENLAVSISGNQSFI